MIGFGKHVRFPYWLRCSAQRGGFNMMEVMVSFLILGIAAVGAIKSFSLGRVGLESEYEYKMAGELLRAKTEWIIGVVHKEMKRDWPASFEYGDNFGEEVIIDAPGNIPGVGQRDPIRGHVYFSPVKEWDDLQTPAIKPDWYEIHTWIEWNSPQQTVWLNGMSGQPQGQRERIDFNARVVPSWLQ